MAIYEQILTILAAHPDGLTIHGLFDVAKTMPRNEIKDVAVLSRNLYGLQQPTGKGSVVFQGDGRSRLYVITQAGKDKLVKKGYDLDKLGIPKPNTTNEPVETQGTSNPPIDDPIKQGIDWLDIPEFLRRDALDQHANINPEGSPLTRADFLRLLECHVLRYRISDLQRKIALMVTLSDLCMDTDTGRILLAIKADLERMDGGDR